MENSDDLRPTENEVWDIISTPIKSRRQQILDTMDKELARINARKHVSPEQLDKIMNTPYGLR